MKKPYSRKRYFINPDFQGRFILSFALICLLGMTISVALFNYLTMREFEALKWKMVIYAGNSADIIAPYLIYISIFAVIFTIVVLIIFSRFLRWRVSGPIYRLKKDLDMVRDGNLALNISLRRKDHFRDSAEELNKMVASLREKFKKLGSDFRATKRIIDTLKDVREDLLAVKCDQLSARLYDLEITAKSLSKGSAPKES
jgi:methyl-accepting chemotaxis protein